MGAVVLILVEISIGSLLVLPVAILLAGHKRNTSSQFGKMVLFASLASLLLTFFLAAFIRYSGIPVPGHFFNLSSFFNSQNTTAFTVQGSENYSGTPVYNNSDTVCSTALIHRETGLPNHFGHWGIFALALWGCGLLLVLLRIGTGIQYIRKLRNASNPLPGVIHTELIKGITDQTGIKGKVELLLSDTGIPPFSFGFLKPAVMLPGDALNWDEECLGIVLLHEFLHIKRKDYLINMLVGIVCAVFWFNPLVWAAAKQYRFLQEAACDDAVLETGVNSCTYAEELVRMAFNYRIGREKILSSSMYGKSNIERRVCKILEDKKSRHINRLWHFTVLLSTVILFSFLFSLFITAGANDNAAGPAYAEGTQTDTYDLSGFKQEDIPDLWPVLDGIGSVMTPFGEIRSKGKEEEFNTGIDIAYNGAIPVIASADGKVVQTGSGFIRIHHKSGIDTYYGDLCIGFESKGSEVSKGELIGYSYTGRIHFEMSKNNVFLNPLNIIKMNNGT